MEFNEENFKTLMATVEDLSQQRDAYNEHQRKTLESLRKVKDERNELKNKVEELSRSFEDYKKQAGLDDEQKSKIDEIVNSKTERIVADYEAKIEELSSKASEFESQYSKLKQNYDQEKIAMELRKTAEKAGVLPEAIDDVILRANGLFSISENGIEARDADGNLLKVNKKVLTPETFVESLKETATHFWPASQGSGANGGGKQGMPEKNPWAKDSINYTEQAKLMESNPDLAEKLKAQAQA